MHMNTAKKWIFFLSVMLPILAVGLLIVWQYAVLPGTTASTETSSSVSTRETANQSTLPPEDDKPSSGQPTDIPSSYSYIVNIRSKVFHDPGCTSTGQMKEHNKRYSDQTRDVLIAQGCKPCGSCKP